MKTTDMTPREFAICKKAATATLANIRAGLVYDLIKLAWVKPEDLNPRQAALHQQRAA